MSRIYRLPLRLITQGKWLRIMHSAKAILPVLGLHADNSGISFPGVKIIQELSGIKSRSTIIEATRSLIDLDLLEKNKEGRRNVYILKPPAIWAGASYYPMSEEFILTEWITLSYIEKAVFGVLAVKAVINDPDLLDISLEITANSPPWIHRFIEFGDTENVFGKGLIQKKKWIRLAGIARRSWNEAIEGLIEKSQIVLSEENDYIIRK